MKNIFLLLLIAIGLSITTNVNSQDKAIYPTGVSKAVYFDKIGPITNLPILTDEQFNKIQENARKQRSESLDSCQNSFFETAFPKGEDPVRQAFMGKKIEPGNLISNWEGQETPYVVPDVNGTPGNEFYLQTVYCSFTIYNKNDGELLLGPIPIYTLFDSVPGGIYDYGDPIALYDDNAGRWLIAVFLMPDELPYHMNIAISETSDPLGNWYSWSFESDMGVDYEKFGIWRDGYYMGTNTPYSSSIYVFEREKMLNGDADAQMVHFQNPWRPESGIFHITPAVDNDGPFAPEGEPGLFITINDDAWNGEKDEIWLYELDVDWELPETSTFNRVQQIEVAPFSSHILNSSLEHNIKQPGTSVKLDGFALTLMNKPQYRNFGNHQSIVACHTVDFNGEDDAGIRWYELIKTDGDWSIRQQGTYAPDNHSRWMGSIAMNADHEIALGYSISSSSVYPGTRYAGQSAYENNQASGIMDISEKIIHNGEFSQTYTNRWGDYSSMDVDVGDNHTFWYTSETVGSENNRNSRIASFDFSAGEMAIADFTSDTQIVADSCQVIFTDMSSEIPVEWEWDFEGGKPATSDERTPTVFYDTPGVYDVSLIINDYYGNIDSITKTNFITVDDNISPEIGFDASDTLLCLKETVSLNDLSSNCPISWHWSFTPETYTFVNETNEHSANPEVRFDEVATYDVALEASNINGSSSMIFEDYFKVKGVDMPIFQDFEYGDLSFQDWDIENPDNEITWSVTEISSEGEYGDHAMFMNFFNYTSDFGQKDLLISPPINLTSYKDATISFDHAFVSRYPNYSDSLSLLVSTDCGDTWERVFVAGEDNYGSFATKEQINGEFYPSVKEDWCGSGWGADCVEIDLTEYVGLYSVKIAFESYNYLGNNLFIDNILIEGTPNAIDENIKTTNSIFPNPANNKIFIKGLTKKKNISVSIFDVRGIEVLSMNSYTQGDVIDISNLSRGMYLVKIITSGQEIMEKLVVR